MRKAVEEPNYLLVAVERGRNLASVSAAASPYAVVEHGGAVMETAPVSGTTHPIWGAHFLFEVHTTAKEVLIVIKDSKVTKKISLVSTLPIAAYRMLVGMTPRYTSTSSVLLTKYINRH